MATTGEKFVKGRHLNAALSDVYSEIKNVDKLTIHAFSIDNNADLDEMTTAGYYFCKSDAIAATLKNSPTTKAFFLTVGIHVGVYQELIESSADNPKFYMRNYRDEVWGDWIRVYTEADKPDTADVDMSAIEELLADAVTFDAEDNESIPEETTTTDTVETIGTCSTGENVADKVVTTSSSWTLRTGASIIVKFSNTNTASNPTINVNGTGAKSIIKDGGTVTTSDLEYAGKVNTYIRYVYNGTGYVYMGHSGDNYSKVVDSLTSTDTASALSAYQGKVLNDKITTITNELESFFGDI
jgi:hypothetical protein